METGGEGVFGDVLREYLGVRRKNRTQRWIYFRRKVRSFRADWWWGNRELEKAEQKLCIFTGFQLHRAKHVADLRIAVLFIADTLDQSQNILCHRTGSI